MGKPLPIYHTPIDSALSCGKQPRVHNTSDHAIAKHHGWSGFLIFICQIIVIVEFDKIIIGIGGPVRWFGNIELVQRYKFIDFRLPLIPVPRPATVIYVHVGDKTLTAMVVIRCSLRKVLRLLPTLIPLGKMYKN